MTQQSPYHLETEAARTLLRDSEPVEEIVRLCNVDGRDHLHLARVGSEGSGLEARGCVAVHEGGRLARVFLAAPELRQLAAGLLNVADAIDGKSPLAFFDPSAPSAEEPER